MVWMSLMAAVAGAAVASLGSALTATELLLLQEEGIALRAAARLSEETIEEREETIRELGGHFADDGDDDLSALERMDQLGAIAGSDAILELSLLDELEDVDLPRPRARIDVDGVLLAGDPSLPRPRVGDCIGFERADGHARACAVPFEEGVLVLSMSTLLSDARPEIMGWSVVVGFLVAAVLGWAGSRVLATWGLGPLATLRDRMARIEPGASSAALGDPLEHEELEQVRRGVAELVDRLGEALHDATRFSSRAAHELRTPLTTIAGELELMAEAADAERRTELGHVRAQVTDLMQLVERLLILADPTHVEVGETVDLADVVDAVCERLDPEAAARVTVTCAEDVLVRGDAPLLRALVTNAVENALKFSEGAVRVNVDDVGAPRITVEDSGPGIDASERALVRDHFQRGERARREGLPGHGIGLTLMDHVARVHGGSLRIVAREPGGTRVEVRLPPWRPASVGR
tara:strand:- start:1064 stop:2458 length:1395 start_codon:yes stop_codon:yes gene_type:complete